MTSRREEKKTNQKFVLTLEGRRQSVRCSGNGRLTLVWQSNYAVPRLTRVFSSPRNEGTTHGARC